MGFRSSSLVGVAIAVLAVFAIHILVSGGGAAKADNVKETPPQRRGSGLPIPRFASLRSDEINVRTGPGTRYPVDWVFKRKSMPVEIVAEYYNSRKIPDWQGASGWAHQSLLTGKRRVLIPSKATSRHNTPSSSPDCVSQHEPQRL